MSNELGPVKAPFRVGFKPTGLAAKIAAAKAAPQVEPERPKEPGPQDAEHRIGIVFDDSGSMFGKKLDDAKAGVEEFLRSCEKDKTAVCIYPMDGEKLPLTLNLPALGILVKKLEINSSTPLRATLERMKKENALTRMIVFSDGIPDNDNLEGINKDFGIVDTVFISSYSYAGSKARTYMKTLAELTGGIFLEFKAGSSNFRTAFKYLSPGLRYMLADKSFVEQIQK
jgi:uncharacterized protein YegL